MKKRKKLLKKKKKTKTPVILSAQRTEFEIEFKFLIKTFWTNENDYLDIIYRKLNELQREHEKYRLFSEEHILMAVGGNDVFSRYLQQGQVKDWVKVFEEYFAHENSKPDTDDWGLGRYIFESDNDEILEQTIKGLSKSLDRCEVSIEDREKLIPLLQDFSWSINGFPNIYYYIITCHGIIGSKKSLSYIRKIIESIDNYVLSGHLGSDGEDHEDYFHYVRSKAILALTQISDEDELDYLFERYKTDLSLNVRNTIYSEISNIKTEKSKAVLIEIADSY
ncbi:MAG: HEAT repeat domain-containing protein [Candidatus Heimdallarchaeota archaeon]